MKITDVLDINAEAERVHTANQKWWHDLHTGERLDRDRGEQLMLVTTEISEAMEGARKNLMDDKLPQYKMEHVEIIDAFIRELDYRRGHGCTEPFIAEDYPGAPKSYISGKEKSYGDTLMAINMVIVEQYRSDTRFASMSGAPTSIMESNCDRVINMLYWYACWRGFADKFVEIYNAKMDFNAVREDHTVAHRLSEHGKKI